MSQIENEAVSELMSNGLPDWADSEEALDAWLDAMYDVSQRWDITAEEAEVFLENAGFWGYER